MKNLRVMQTQQYEQNKFKITLPHAVYCEDNSNINFGSLYGNLYGAVIIGLYNEDKTIKYDELYLVTNGLNIASDELSFDHNVPKEPILETDTKIYAIKDNDKFRKIELPIVYEQGSHRYVTQIGINHYNNFPLIIHLDKLEIKNLSFNSIMCYLTQNSRVIWNLSYADYTLDTQEVSPMIDYGIKIIFEYQSSEEQEE